MLFSQLGVYLRPTQDKLANTLPHNNVFFSAGIYLSQTPRQTSRHTTPRIMWFFFETGFYIYLRQNQDKMQTGLKGTIYLRQRLKTAPEQYLLSPCFLVTGLHLNQRQSAGCPKTKVLVLVSSSCGLLGSNHNCCRTMFFF